MIRCLKNRSKNQLRGISTWIYEFRPGNKTIYVVFDEESEFSGPRTPKLSPDQVFEESIPYKTLLVNVIFSLLVELGRHNIRQFPITSPRRTGPTKWHNRKRFPITSPRRTAFESTFNWIVEVFWLQCASVSL